MNEKLQITINQIEQAGNQFNDSRNENKNTYKDSAYKVILDYIISENIELSSYNWNEIISNYTLNGLDKVLPELQNNHSYIQSANFIDGDIPLDIMALFNTMDIVFHEPTQQKYKKVLFVDMDNVIVDFVTAFPLIDDEVLEEYLDNKDEIPGIFGKMSPMQDAISSIETLYKYFDLYLLSTSPWQNDTAWSDKIAWVKKHLPVVAYKRLILSHHKNLNFGDYLIDDRIRNGVLKFQGEHIHFGSESFPDWKSTTAYLLNKVKNAN